MQQDPLTQLRDIHLPEPGGFWPPAPGWWVVALLVLVCVAVAAVLVRRKRLRNRWLKTAWSELNQLSRQPEPNSQWFADLNRLLKRCARIRYPERLPESLSGEAWVHFLLDTSPRDRIASRPVVEAMVTASWQPTPGLSQQEAIAFARRWLGGQRC